MLALGFPLSGHVLWFVQRLRYSSSVVTKVMFTVTETDCIILTHIVLMNFLRLFRRHSALRSSANDV